jgi:hypothetical protein
LTIDDPFEVVSLINAMQEALPLAARARPPLAAVVRDQVPDWSAARPFEISEVSYAGDEGGIMCRFRAGDVHEAQTFHTSITHLAFDRRAPLARQIARYQKRRTKRLKWLHALTGAFQAADEVGRP